LIPIETWAAKAGKLIRNDAPINVIIKKRLICSSPLSVIGNPPTKHSLVSQEVRFQGLSKVRGACRSF
jgi:hypothetical protein